MKKILLEISLVMILFVSASGALAATVDWTDWTSVTSAAPGVVGTLNAGTIDVAFSGQYSFAQTNGGTNFWNPSTPYISSTVSNAPPASDIIALGNGGTATITFSQPVLNPLLALVSWNGNTVDFGVPIQILSYGAGYWGNGTPILNGAGTGFFGSGEVHGVIELPGTFSMISFTHTTEYWHGFTVGIEGLPGPSTGVPEPATMLLLGSGMVGMVPFVRRKFKK